MAALAIDPEATVSVDEYLHSVYEPDMDFVDGILEDRNVGEFDHAKIQRALLMALVQGEDRGGYFVIQETRMQVSPTRFRVPDTCLIASDNLPHRIIREAPLLCIEVLSPEDRVTRLQRRCQDYLDMGVPEVWLLDPVLRVAYVTRGETMTQYREGSLKFESLGLDIKLADIFKILDRR
jgi:Uma2 family endonuclease